jgi:hypothetical protein
MKTIKDENYSKEHTKKRLQERYNITNNLDLYYDLLCVMINNNIDCTFVSEEDQKRNPQQVYDVVINNTKIRVVWDKKNKYVKTVLPPDGKL